MARVDEASRVVVCYVQNAVFKCKTFYEAASVIERFLEHAAVSDGEKLIAMLRLDFLQNFPDKNWDRLIF